MQGSRLGLRFLRGFQGPIPHVWASFLRLKMSRLIVVMSTKVGVPKLNTTMVRCQFKHSHQKVIICSKESCLCVQNMLKHSKLNSQYDLRDNMYDH